MKFDATIGPIEGLAGERLDSSVSQGVVRSNPLDWSGGRRLFVQVDGRLAPSGGSKGRRYLG
jgi:hypothetical protein